MMWLTIALQSGSVGSDAIDVRRRLVYVGLKGRPGHVFLVEGDVYGIVPGFGGQVGHRAGPVAVVPAVDGGLAGAFDRDPQSTLASTPGVDQEVGGLVYQAPDQAWTRDPDSIRVAVGHAADPARTARHGLAFEAYAEQVLADLARGEVDEVAFERRLDQGLAACTSRRYYNHLDVRGYSAGRVWREHAKLLETVHGCG